MSNTDDIQSIIDIVKSCENAVLATNRLDRYPDVRTIMNALNTDITDLHLHFITDADSPKFKQIAHNPKSCIYYFNPETRMAVRLFGEMQSVDDIDTKKKYWHDRYRQFGYTGPDDANLILMEFMPKTYKFYDRNDELKTGLI